MNDSDQVALIDDISDEDDELNDENNARNTSKTKYDQKELNNYEEALTRIGVGRFHYLVLVICSLAVTSDAVEVLCVSFILPSAECDLKLSSKDKGFLSAITFLGMMIGGYIWGTFSDLVGRKKILIIALLLNGSFGLLAGISQTFGGLVFFRLLSGIGIGGSLPVVWSYFAEFMPKNIRGRMLCCLASSWLFGNLLVVFLGFLILNKTNIHFVYFSNSIIINNWRLFMIICSIPSILTAILLLFLPESPKFYLYNCKYVETQKVLQYIYLFNNKINTTQDIDAKWRAFKFFEKLKHRPIINTYDYNRNRIHNSEISNNFIGKIKIHCKNVLNQTSLLFKPPYGLQTILILFIMFSLCFGYYGLWMWLPELFKRMSIYGGSPCKPKFFNATIENNDVKKVCLIETSVFTSSLVAALSNLPGNIFTIIFIDKIGRNIITVSTLISSGILILGIGFIMSQTQGTVITTIFGALNTLSFNSFGCTTTELYPTTLRATALGTQALAGRSGAILANILFGLAVDASCYIPLSTISILLIISGLLAIKLPESSQLDIH